MKKKKQQNIFDSHGKRDHIIPRRKVLESVIAYLENESE